MNSLKNLRHTLSPILRRSPAAVRPKLPSPPPKPSARRYCYYTSPRRPEALQPSRGLFLRIINPAVNRPPTMALPRHYSSWSSFIANPLRGGRRWYENQRIVFAAVATTCGVVITLCFGTFETVPYSNRTHFIVVTPNWERRSGESKFNKTKKELEKTILPPEHPHSVRVRKLVTEIVGATHRGLARRVNSYAGDASYGDITSGHDTEADAAAHAGRHGDDGCWYEGIPAGHDTGANDAPRRAKEVLDDKSVLVPKNRNRWKARGAPLQTKHLDGLNWEVIVVENKAVNAMCLPGGKIVVYTGLLETLKTDAEVATVLGHEVGHVIARHAAEMITKNIWILILQFLIQIFCDASAEDMDKISSLLLKFPFSRR